MRGSRGRLPVRAALLALGLCLALGACGPGGADQGGAGPQAGGATAAGPGEGSRPMAAPPPFVDPSLRGLDPSLFVPLVRALPRTRGTGGVLRLQSGSEVQEVQDLQIVDEGGLDPGGAWGINAEARLGGRKRYLKFVILGNERGAPEVKRILLARSLTQVPYAWSEERGLWLAGAEEPLKW